MVLAREEAIQLGVAVLPVSPQNDRSRSGTLSLKIDRSGLPQSVSVDHLQVGPSGQVSLLQRPQAAQKTHMEQGGR